MTFAALGLLIASLLPLIRVRVLVTPAWLAVRVLATLMMIGVLRHGGQIHSHDHAHSLPSRQQFSGLQAQLFQLSTENHLGSPLLFFDGRQIAGPPWNNLTLGLAAGVVIVRWASPFLIPFGGGCLLRKGELGTFYFGNTGHGEVSAK